MQFTGVSLRELKNTHSTLITENRTYVDSIFFLSQSYRKLSSTVVFTTHKTLCICTVLKMQGL